MRQRLATSERSSGAEPSVFYGASPAFDAASFSVSVSAPAASRILPSPEISFASERARDEARDGIDRAFFLWILAGLIAAAFACGAVAMSAFMTGPPGSG